MSSSEELRRLRTLRVVMIASYFSLCLAFGCSMILPSDQSFSTWACVLVVLALLGMSSAHARFGTEIDWDSPQDIERPTTMIAVCATVAALVLIGPVLVESLWRVELGRMGRGLLHAFFLPSTWLATWGWSRPRWLFIRDRNGRPAPFAHHTTA